MFKVKHRLQEECRGLLGLEGGSTNIQKEFTNRVANELVSVMDEDIQNVIDSLAISRDEAMDRLRVIHQQEVGGTMTFIIMDYDTLEVYRRRTIHLEDSIMSRL